MASDTNEDNLPFLFTKSLRISFVEIWINPYLEQRALDKVLRPDLGGPRRIICKGLLGALQCCLYLIKRYKFKGIFQGFFSFIPRHPLVSPHYQSQHLLYKGNSYKSVINVTNG